MSAPVDVLAVLDHDRRLLSAALVASDRAKETLRQHDETRAAVAELIASLPALIDIVRGRAPVALGVIRRAEAALARVLGAK